MPHRFKHNDLMTITSVLPKPDDSPVRLKEIVGYIALILGIAFVVGLLILSYRVT